MTALYFAVWATDQPGMLEVRQRVREAHRARLRDPGEYPVRVLLGGATLDDSAAQMNGTLLVIQAEHIDAVRRFVAEDPYVREGVYRSVEVRPWAWGLCQPKESP
jgi:uncharacterized protein YciI